MSKLIVKPVKDFPNYTVSTTGEVWRIQHIRTDKNLVRYNIPRSKMVGTICKDGYWKVSLSNPKGRKPMFIHRLVLSAFVENKENKRTVNHIDGSKLNNNLENLEWATDKENVQHAFRSGLKNNKGVNNSQSKLTESQVREMRKLKGKIPLSQIADMFNVSKGHVSNILRGYNWRDV